MGKIRKILETELVGGTQSTDVYPVTSTKAVYDTNNKVLDDYIQHLKKTSTFAGIATPTTNPDTPDGPVFYIAGEGTYVNFSNLVIGVGQLGILKWDGTWSKQVLEIGAGGGSGGGSGVSLRTLLTKLNSDNPFPTTNGQVLTYDGTNFVWKTPTGSGGSTTGGIRIKRNGSTLKDSTGNVLSCTSINFKYGENWNSTPILINSDNEISVDLSVVANNGNGSSSSTLYPLTIYNGSSNNDYITYDGSSSAYLKFKSGFSISKVGLGYEISVSGGSGVTLNPTMSAMNSQLGKTTLNTPQFLYWDGSTYTWKNESEISGGSGSSSRINKIKLFNSAGKSFKTVSLGTADTIGFMAGNNVALEAVVKEHTNVIKISATGGGSGGSTSTSVSWQDVTNKPNTFTPSSHTHSAAEITNFASTVKGIKVDDASHADAANKLASSVSLWGNNFNGVRNIGSSTSNKADLRYVNNIYTGDTFGLYNTVNGIDTSLLSIDNTPNVSIAYGYRSNENAILSLFGNKTKIYTNGQNYHFDFVRNVFDVNSNQIHFGSETNGGKISWDAANNAFKIEGNVYATGGITALGVSNNATTSNNVDFTFGSVTINGIRQNKVKLTDEGLVFYNQNTINAYYKNDSIGLYDSANNACCKIFGFTDSEFVFDPDRYGIAIRFNTAIECPTDENKLIVGNNSINGYIIFSAGSTMIFNHNNKNYNFNVAKAIEQGILTI